MKKEKTHILSLQKNNSGKELEFENEFQLSLSVKQRYRRMKKFIKQTMDYEKNMTIQKLLQSLVEHKVKFLVVGAWTFPAYGKKYL